MQDDTQVYDADVAMGNWLSVQQKLEPASEEMPPQMEVLPEAELPVSDQAAKAESAETPLEDQAPKAEPTETPLEDQAPQAESAETPHEASHSEKALEHEMPPEAEALESDQAVEPETVPQVQPEQAPGDDFDLDASHLHLLMSAVLFSHGSAHMQ